MKRKVSLAILGTMLQGSAHAAEPSAIAEPSLSKDSLSHSASATDKKTKAMRGKKTKPGTRAGCS